MAQKRQSYRDPIAAGELQMFKAQFFRALAHPTRMRWRIPRGSGSSRSSCEAAVPCRSCRRSSRWISQSCRNTWPCSGTRASFGSEGRSVGSIRAARSARARSARRRAQNLRQPPGHLDGVAPRAPPGKASMSSHPTEPDRYRYGGDCRPTGALDQRACGVVTMW
jgi:hypothetical protein